MALGFGYNYFGVFGSNDMTKLSIKVLPILNGKHKVEVIVTLNFVYL